MCLLAIACGGCAASSSHHADRSPIRIAALLSVSEQDKTLRSLQREINDSGGVGGRPLEIEVFDTASDAARAVAVASDLAADASVVAVIGPSTSAETLRAMPILEQAKIPTISLASSQDIVNPVRPWVFKVAPSDSQAVGRVYDYLSRHEVERVAVLSADDAFGSSGQKQLREQAPGFGITITAASSYASAEPDEAAIGSFLAQVESSPAQALIVWGTAPAVVARLAAEAAVPQTIVYSHGVASSEFLQQCGRAAEGALLPACPLLVVDSLPLTYAGRPTLLRYQKWYAARCAGEATAAGGQAWDACRLLVDAIRAVGTDRTKIRSYLEETENFMGVGGTFHFSPQDHNGLSRSALVMIAVHDGKWVLQQ